MARRKRTDYGPDANPETIGWQRLMSWLEKDGNTVAALARGAQVSQPSAHAWRWRDASPTGDKLRFVCRVTGSTIEEWGTLVPRRRRGKAA